MSDAEPVPPNFFLIGAPKAGSSSLWHALRQHPDVFMPDLKEPNFFCDDNERSAAWYRALFEGSDGHGAVGEASVEYSLVERTPGTPARLARRVPGARLLYIVRHPLRRIESSWRHHLYVNNPMPDTFAGAVRQKRPLIAGTLYMRNLDCYRQHYPDANIRVVFLEDFARDPQAVLAACDRFLGVDASARASVPERRKNVSDGKKRVHSLVHSVHEAKWWRYVRTLVPDAARHFVVDRTRQALPDRPTWDPATRAWALDQVRGDAQAILEYAGKPPDFWTFEGD